MLAWSSRADGANEDDSVSVFSLYNGSDDQNESVILIKSELSFILSRTAHLNNSVGTEEEEAAQPELCKL